VTLCHELKNSPILVPQFLQKPFVDWHLNVAGRGESSLVTLGTSGIGVLCSMTTVV
jgi:hypothetical protein